MPKFLFISHRGTTLKPSIFLFNTPVTTQPERFKDLTGRLTGGNRLNCRFWFEVWIWPVFSGNRSNRSGLPEPDSGGFIQPVGEKKPWFHVGTTDTLSSEKIYRGCSVFYIFVLAQEVGHSKIEMIGAKSKQLVMPFCFYILSRSKLECFDH